MNTKEKTIEEQFAEAADKGFPEFENLIAERAEIHAVMELSLADIYDTESKRRAAKYGKDDPGVALAKLKKTDATAKAKEIVEILVTTAKSAAPQPAPKPTPKPEPKPTPKPTPKSEPKPAPKPVPKPKKPKAKKVTEVANATKLRVTKAVPKATRVTKPANTAKPVAPKTTQKKTRK